MDIILASAWHPRGEFTRFEKLLPQLMEVYAGVVITLPPDTDPSIASLLDHMLSVIGRPRSVVVMQDWPRGRHMALQRALELPASHVHYIDLDRLVRWVETRPDEWRRGVQAIQKVNCLVHGRSTTAYQTHPQAMAQTEAISNLVTSYLLGKGMDVSAGSKGFSRRAVEYLVSHCNPQQPFGADADWLVTLHRAGFMIDYVEVDGLDWEIADQHQEQAASAERQRQMAEAYDADPKHWKRRVAVAMEIVQSGLEATRRQVELPEPLAFDFDATFQVDDYMYFYRDMMPDELTEQQVSLLVQELELNPPMQILDLACGFGRHANRLAALGHQVTGIDLMEGFLDLARQDASDRGVSVDYRQGDMRQIDFVEAFDRVLLMFTAFGYFEDDENLNVFRNVARALKPAGLFIFDIQNRDTFLKGFSPDHVTEKEGNLMIDQHTFDCLTGRLYNRRIVIRNSVRHDKPFFVRLYNPTEIRELLRQVGLEVYKSFGSWNGEPVSPESRRMIIIAKKSGISDQ